MTMTAEPRPMEVEAPRGQKMIEICVKFFTNDIAPTEGHVVPRHAWTAGMIHISRNEVHGLVGPALDPNPVPFNSLPEILTKIEEVLISHGVKLHPSTVMKKYVA